MPRRQPDFLLTFFVHVGGGFATWHGKLQVRWPNANQAKDHVGQSFFCGYSFYFVALKGNQEEPKVQPKERQLEAARDAFWTPRKRHVAGQGAGERRVTHGGHPAAALATWGSLEAGEGALRAEKLPPRFVSNQLDLDKMKMVSCGKKPPPQIRH